MAKKMVMVHHPKRTPEGTADGPVSERYFEETLKGKGYKLGPRPEKKGK
jgi:hypothetical protein